MRFHDCRSGMFLFKWSVRNDFQTSVWVTAHHSRRRRCLWWEAEPVWTEGAAGNRWPFLLASLPRNIGHSQRGDNTFTAPTGRLKPIGRPEEKPVVTGHLGRGRRRLYPGRVKPANRRVGRSPRSGRNTQSVCGRYTIWQSGWGRSWMLQRRNANANCHRRTALCKWSSLDFPCFQRASSLQTMHSGSLPDGDVT